MGKHSINGIAAKCYTGLTPIPNPPISYRIIQLSSTLKEEMPITVIEKL